MRIVGLVLARIYTWLIFLPVFALLTMICGVMVTNIKVKMAMNIMLKSPAVHTERSARSGFPAPRFCPIKVAAAFESPHGGNRAKMMMRMEMV